MPLDLYIKLGPYKFSLQAFVDHHGYSINSGHYTASINCCGQTFHCNDNLITECNITDTIYCLYTFIQTHNGMLGRQYVSKDVCRCWYCRVSTAWPRRMGADRLPWCRHSCLSLYNRKRNRHRNLWDGLCVSSWRPLVWLGPLWPLFLIK